MLARFTWFRQAAFRWADEERTIYLDPWGTPRDAPPADLIMITHAHFDHFQPEDVLVADRVEGATQFTRLDSAKLDNWLKDYSLGQLWEKNELGGRPGGE